MALKEIAQKENKHQLMDGKASKIAFSEEHQNCMCFAVAENSLLGISFFFSFNRFEVNILNYFLSSLIVIKNEKHTWLVHVTCVVFLHFAVQRQKHAVESRRWSVSSEASK